MMVLTNLFLLFLFAVSLGRALERPKVQTPRGTLIGNYNTSRNGSYYETYLGIRYGHVTQRFDPSVPTGSWSGLKDAGNFGPFCSQITLIGAPPIGIEDCLYLNVYTPRSDDRKRAVLVYIHGGGFVVGSTLEYGGDFLADEDLVVVTLSYRLGILGFMNLEDGTVSGNNAFKDQVLALKWVQENIESFGGDKNRVTISGNSAGGASTLYLLISPMARGLFHGVYDQSGSPLNPWGYTKSIKPVISEMGASLNCSTSNSRDIVDCFRRAPVEDLLNAQSSTARNWALDLFRAGPSLEVVNTNHKYKIFLGKSPESIMRSGDFGKVPLLLSIAQDEGSLVFGSVVIRNDQMLKALNENASSLDAVAFLFDQYPNLNYRKDEVSRRAREFYFGGQTIRKDAEQGLMDLYSDTWFLRGIRKTAKLLGAHIPVYLGHFSYKRKDGYSPLAGLGISDKVDSVSHCEDLSYIFNPTGLPNPFPHIGELRETRDIDFSKKFVRLLASFIKTGIPTVPFGNGPRWDPVLKGDIDRDSLNFLNLGEDPYLHFNPYADRVNFWDNLEYPCGETPKDDQ